MEILRLYAKVLYLAPSPLQSFSILVWILPVLAPFTASAKHQQDRHLKQQHMSRKKYWIKCDMLLELWSVSESFFKFQSVFRFHPFSNIMQHPSQQMGGISDISKYPHLRQLWPPNNANNLSPGSFQVQVTEQVSHSAGKVAAWGRLELGQKGTHRRMNLSMGIHGFLKVVTRICQSCYKWIYQSCSMFFSSFAKQNHAEV